MADGPRRRWRPIRTNKWFGICFTLYGSDVFGLPNPGAKIALEVRRADFNLPGPDAFAFPLWTVLKAIKDSLRVRACQEGDEVCG